MATVFIGLGTNLGDREQNLVSARRLLGPEVRITAESSIIETPPWGFAEQPDFLNQVVRGTTSLTPPALLKHLKSVETRIGRTPSFRFGPRLIDLDILYYDDLVLSRAEIEIPHPRLHDRLFVLVPLLEIAPDQEHPVFRKSTHALLESLRSQERGIDKGEKI